MIIDINKRHNHRTPLSQHSDKKHKIWWGRAAGGSGSCAIVRLRPKKAMTKIYLVVGGAGNVTNYNGTTGNVYMANSGGFDSGIGTMMDYSSNVLVCPGAPAFYCYSGNFGGAEPVLNGSELFDIVSAVRLSAGNPGTAATLYNSYTAPSTTPGYSAFDGTVRGYGAGGYNSGNSNIGGVGGYVKVTVV